MLNPHRYISLLILTILMHCLPALAQSGGDANANALFEAASAGNLAAIKKALDQGISVKAKDKDGVTALMLAASEGKLAAVQALVRAGAEVNSATKDGLTPLMSAAFSGNVALVKFLLSEGANKNALTTKGLTAADIAVQAKKPEIAKLLAPASNATSSAKVGSSKQIAATEAAAVKAYQEGRFGEAAGLFKELVVLAPRNANAWHFLGQAQAKSGELEEARTAYSRSLEIEPRGDIADSTRRLLEDMRVAEEARKEREQLLRAAEEERKVRDEFARSLQWAEADNGSHINWNDAKHFCASKGTGWRLPTVAELQANYRWGHSTPCSNYNNICKVSSNSRLTSVMFWSNEPDDRFRPDGSSYAWGVSLLDGDKVNPMVDDGRFKRALCVRRP